MDLKDKWVLVTGAAKRIGQAIAIEFAKQGCHVLLHYHHSESSAKKTASQIKSLGRKVELLSLDLTNSTIVHDWAQQNATSLQKLSVLVHSASLFYPTHSTSSEASKRSLYVIHSESPLALSRAFSEGRDASRPGVIINITDAMIEKPYPQYVDYFISKGALQEQTRALSIEYAPHVRVNAVAPGCVLFPEDYDEDRKKTLLQSVPLKREGTPQDIANACVFLTKHEYITGQTLKVDGGRSLS